MRDSGKSIDAELREAEQLQQAGRLDEADALFISICEQHPRHAEAHRRYGLLTFQRQQPEASLELLRRAAELDPGSPAATNDLAEACFALGRFADAEAALRESLARAPGDPGPYLRLAIIQQRRGDSEKAIELGLQALERDPDLLGAHQLLGALYYRSGRLEAAAEHLGRARASVPHGADPYHLLASTLFALGRDGEIAGLSTTLEPGEVYGETMLRALAAWQTGNVDACHGLLVAAQSQFPSVGEVPNRGIFATFMHYLDHLLAYRKSHPELYAGAADDTLYLLGDSHCLAPADVTVALDGARLRVAPRLVLGCKAWHLVRPEPGPQASAFEATVSRLPEGARTLVTIGELDCRFSEGLLPYLKKTPGLEPDSVIDDLVARYVDKVVATAATRRLALRFMTPPASNIDRRRIPTEDRALFGYIGRRFNESLRQAVAAAGCGLVDVNAVTTDADGNSRPEYYIDTNHTLPNALRDACAAIDA